MTLGTVSGSDTSSAASFCSCCGAKMVPYFSDDAVVSKNQINQLISESFLTVKGAALFLPRGNSPTPNSAPRISQRRNKHTGDLQKHLQTMFTVLRPEDTIRLAVRLECAYPQVTRYMVVVSTNGRQDTEESIVLGMDFVSSDSCCTVGLVLPLWSDTLIHLDGDGGFSVSTVNRVHVFKPVSVQAMWSSLQSLHKACEVARCHNYYPGSLFLTWVSYYQSRVSSNQFCINEWNAMQDVESHRANSPVLFTDLPTERERTERLIKIRLREIMMQKDLENVTCKEIRTELEMQMVCNLRQFKEFIDNEMIVILGQMDSPTEIFEHVYLGSEWNASNLEELQNSGVRYILNVTREIDNFFPGMFEYHNIRVYDEEATNLLEYWNETYKFITKAKKAGAKCLVHCKMGVSRSASTVIAYAMKEYGWDLDTAFDYVKERRTVTKPNPSFMKQLEEYQGILLASKQRHNKLWRSHSDSDLSDRPELLCKPSPHSLGRSDSHNNNTSSPSLHHFLGVAVLQALGRSSSEEISPLTMGSSDSDIINQSLSDLTGDKHTPLSSATTTPLPLVAPLVSSDDNNNPSELHIGSAFDSRGEADGSSNHSADSIDFFSAREKFLGLAQDDRTRTLSEQAQQRMPVSTDGETEANEEEEEEQGNGTSQVKTHSVYLPGHYKGASSERTPPGLEVGQRLRERQEGRSFVEPTGWHRAMELEARIRQAGLTPPSLMKRSASLAKLDCLELSANDLSDLDLRPHSRTTSSHSQDSFSLSQSHPDDTWKKQKVLSQNSCAEKTGLSSDGTSSAPSLCPSSTSTSTHGCPRDNKGEREEPDGSGGSVVSSARQQGRGHSSRHSRKAEKKQRAVTVLYNTM
uniref:protein-serine/threonine phosphatase n=1 Tax=Amphiprion ocellaris TaxID=80972 RepID=A0AAQ5YUF5_AMPOC